ncbi:MAG: hypothetical protein A2932_00930 [Candidatus Spechtbacteria bacterium RIFCSPLOWO2_01_FULL_46_10]|uniref:Type 4 fimbrial biogenesis protein PilX N-terminal domain-containing protein n=1 Tax=Candidatus Spechtbacteria bacterium RIFCSPLOWO2_01_FULL_46_10 TaxID=1802163 RepID=A0A1G2HG31_9BACT|nr:MAG: hypothetical protein A2932_00930 [Candidatus Spechtbacteria bacterium RIFCSPLOWO2_01_FULL_46_10]
MSKVSKNQSGVAALLITIVIMGVGTIIAVSATFVFLNRIEASRNIGFSERAYYAAEAGLEDALIRFFDANKQVPSLYSFSINGTAVDVSISTDEFNITTISADGNTSSRRRSAAVRIGLDPSATSLSFAAHIGTRGLTMDSNSTVNGNVFSNGNITGSSNSDINGDATAVGTISTPNPQVSGAKEEGVDPVPLPNFDGDVWREAANINNDPINGDIEIDDETVILGPRRINGNLTIDGNSVVTITGPVYVTGNILVDSNSDIFLDEGFGSENTVILADGSIEFKSNAQVHSTSADPAGYILFASMSNSSEAIKLGSNQIIDGAFYAANGDLELNSNADVTAIIGEGVRMGSNAEVNFDLGLILQIFSVYGEAGYDIIDWEEQ